MTPAVPSETEAAVTDERATALEAARRRTRNRMLIVAVIVVLVGAALLRLVDRHGIVKVPGELGRSQPAAAVDLRRAGLVPTVVPTTAPGRPAGTVVAQSPQAGTQVRPGRTVQLQVAASGGAHP